MRNILHPAWLFISNTLPIVVMAAVYYGNLTVINSLLSEESITLWITFAVVLAVLWLITLGYAVFCLVKRQRTSLWYYVFVLFTLIAFLYVYAVKLSSLIPWRIPGWMMPEDITVYAGTFLMPAMAHALFSLVVLMTRKVYTRRAAYNLIGAAALPIAWYLFYLLILPLWNLRYEGYTQHVLFVLFIVSSVLFLFYTVRGIYILIAKRVHWAGHIALRFIIVWILPLTGLLVNKDMKVFGDFSHPAFFILTFINGLLLLLPNNSNKRYRVLIFTGRSITFAFTLYFFLVFLPYLPLSLVAVLAVGVGFLMLSPLVLMITHCRVLYADMVFLQSQYTTRFVYALLIAGLVTLPLSITWACLRDKATLNQALSHVYTPDYSKQSTLSETKLHRVLKTVKDFKTENERGLEKPIPFLTSYYNWLVLDHLTLSETKIKTLERVFEGTEYDSSESIFGEPFTSPDVKVTKVHTSSQYDVQQKAWRSTIKLSITNATSQQSEFVTSFKLPAGSWIDSYALWIGNEKTEGILAEKKSATWVYQQITTYRQDPGILYYLTGNRVALRIFPLESGETRRTSFTLLHKEAVQFTINEKPIALGENMPGVQANPEKAGRAVYLSKHFKQALTPVKRSPHTYFIIDCSRDAEPNAQSLLDDVASFCEAQYIDPQQATFVLTDAYTTHVEGLDEARRTLADYTFRGGFFLERGLKQILMTSLHSPTAEYPQMIVVSYALNNAIMTQDLADLQWAFPDSDYFFHLSRNGNLVPHSLTKRPLEVVSHPLPPLPYAVGAWPNATNARAYVRLDDEPSIVLEDPDTDRDPIEAKPHNWNSALELHSDWMALLVHPERTANAWLPLIRGSFQAKVMTPLTSFLAVENEAQRQALLKKQDDVLNANPNLDAGEETRMSEPGVWFMALAVSIILFAKRNTLRRFFLR